MSGRYGLKNKLIGALFGALLVLTGCGGGGGDGGSSGGSLTPSASVSVSGKITYDFVPAVASKDQSGNWLAKLDYPNTVRKPARNIVVELVDDSGKVLQSTQTDVQGNYVFQAPFNTSVHVRAKAQLLRATGSGPSWNFAVRDNSSTGYSISGDSAALYAMDGANFNSGTQASIHDLNAPSGWGGSSYTAPRVAGPFAILDTVYAASQKVLQANQNAAFPPLNIFWSPGSMDGTYFGSVNGPNFIGLHIRGKEDVDTDEYDAGVIAHEWGHYFQASFSRDDSIGGTHGPGDLLDMRLAFSEGWGNAFSSMARNDPMYIDTFGPQQASPAVVFKVDEIPATDPKAWFSETAVQSVLYRLHQSPTVGFSPIYQAMTTQTNTPALTSLFSFATPLRGQVNAAGQTTIDNLLAEINTVNGSSLDPFGVNQVVLPPSVSAGNGQFVLPVYTQLLIGQGTRVCSTITYGGINKLGVYRYLRFNIPQTGVHQLKLVTDAGLTPEFQLFSQGNPIDGQFVKDSTAADTYNLSYVLPAQNNYVATIKAKVDTQSGCFTVTLVQ
ncbi:hypothetical protein [Paraherbaspirillum soli]|uniref:Lipoprotein n=1 Tax=Paraherbaspirillum soli TaxID=631222 RepID=A0ABW0M3D5_9BURK